jgi:hypothetical protein
MADLWIPGVPIDVGNWHGYHTCRPEVSCHRTYGGWGGDYSVIKSGGLAHLLIGKNEGQWCQFAPANVVQYHDAVNVGYGVEITGVNEEDFTDWQVRCMAYCLPQLERMIGVPRVYSDGSEGWVDVNYWNGWHSHHHIIPSNGGSQHTNLWKRSDWDRILQLVQGGSTPAPEEEEDYMITLIQYAGHPEGYRPTYRIEVHEGKMYRVILTTPQLLAIAHSGACKTVGWGVPVIKVLDANDFSQFMDVPPGGLD